VQNCVNVISPFLRVSFSEICERTKDMGIKRGKLERLRKKLKQKQVEGNTR
jgi:hypothetical protein